MELTVRISLREAEEAANKIEEDEETATWRGSTADRKGYNDSDSLIAISMGNQPLNNIMSGGIALGSLSLIDGTPSSGKSVLCQHITYESLLMGYGVTYFTSDDT